MMPEDSRDDTTCPSGARNLCGARRDTRDLSKCRESISGSGLSKGAGGGTRIHPGSSEAEATR
jgi:hypothetical protein